MINKNYYFYRNKTGFKIRKEKYVRGRLFAFTFEISRVHVYGHLVAGWFGVFAGHHISLNTDPYCIVSRIDIGWNPPYPMKPGLQFYNKWWTRTHVHHRAEDGSLSPFPPDVKA